MAEHSTLTGASLHEPKGASTATSGQIYTANGLGSGVWKDTVGAVHGQMEIVGNTTGLATTAAVDTTLNTDTDYSKVTGLWSAPTSTTNVGIVFSVDKIIVPDTGTYELSFWGSFTSPNSSITGFKFAINDVAPYSVPKIKRSSTASTDWGVLAAQSLVDLSANDIISMYYANTVTNATGIVIEDATLILTLVSET